jgi:hypothetical protein
VYSLGGLYSRSAGVLPAQVDYHPDAEHQGHDLAGEQRAEALELLAMSMMRPTILEIGYR